MLIVFSTEISDQLYQTILADIKKFGRRMRLDEFFHDSEAVSSDCEQPDHDNSYDRHSFY